MVKVATDSYIMIDGNHIKTVRTTHLKIGAKNTQISRIWTGMFNVCNNQCIPPEVIINPGYTVPPTILPNGYQARSSNQFKKS